MIQKHLQQSEICAGQNDLLTIGMEQAVGHDVEPPLVKGHDLVARSRTYAGKLRTAQQRLDSRLELAGAEGFAQVIIGAQFQANHPIGFVGTGGEHDDGDLGKTRMLTHPAA